MATEAKKLNVHQRKLAAMAMVKGISPDKKHPHHKFDYVSIQNLSDKLREILVEVGLDALCGVDPENHLWRVQLINVDDPQDRIVEHFPLIPEDKGFAYTTKYPLIRLLLVGDGEEGDEAEMATKSGAAATQFSDPVIRPVPRRENGNGSELEKQLAASVEAVGATRPTPQPSRPFRRPDAPVVGPSNAPSTPRQARLLDEEPPPPSDADAPPGVRR